MVNLTEDEIEQFHNQISERVKKIRIEYGLTQLDLALELGFKNPSFISHVENKKIKTHHYSLEHLYKISKALKIDICLLVK